MAKVWEYESNETDALSIQVKKNPDIVMTNPVMAKYLIDLIELKEGDVVMEPCLGKGAFYNAIPSYAVKEFCEINEGRDYLAYQGQVDVTLSNPPFVPRALFWSFHQKAMDTTRREIYWLINLSSLNVFTPKRLEEMKGKGWYIQSFHIISDKRWFGRYTWLKISREPSTVMSWCGKSF
jgi:hypothetical protein